MKKLVYVLMACAVCTLPAAAQDFDPTFGGDGWVTETINPLYQGTTDVLVQPDQKVVVAGFTLDANDRVRPYLLRYLPNGTRDNGFGSAGLVYPPYDPSIGCDDRINIARQPDGKLLVATSGYTTNGTVYLTRLLADGSVDNTFGNAGTVADSTGNAVYLEHVYALAVQADGKILTAGNYSHTNPNSTGAWVMRHHADGSLDNSFGTGGLAKIVGENYVANRLLIQPDGKILGGGKKRYTTQQKDDFLVFRLNADGSPDNTYGPQQDGTVVLGLQDIETVRGMGLQSDGSLVFGGPCGNGYTHIRLVRLQPNGTGDLSFGTHETSTGGIGYTQVDLTQFANQGITDLAVLPDDKIMIGGYWDVNRFLALRFTADGILDSTFSGDARVDSSFGQQNNGNNRVALDLAAGRMYVVGSRAGNGESNCYTAAVKIGPGTAPGSVAETQTATLAIYPNPATGMVYLPQQAQAYTGLQVYNSTGQCVTRQNTLTDNRLHLEHLPAGVYYLRVQAGAQTYTARLLLHK